MSKEAELLKQEWKNIGKLVLADKSTQEAIGISVGLLFVHRKLKKLGFSKGEVYVLTSVISALTYIRTDLKAIRRQLEKSGGSSLDQELKDFLKLTQDPFAAN